MSKHFHRECKGNSDENNTGAAVNDAKTAKAHFLSYPYSIVWIFYSEM